MSDGRLCRLFRSNGRLRHTAERCVRALCFRVLRQPSVPSGARDLTLCWQGAQRPQRSQSARPRRDGCVCRVARRAESRYRDFTGRAKHADPHVVVLAKGRFSCAAALWLCHSAARGQGHTALGVSRNFARACRLFAPFAAGCCFRLGRRDGQGRLDHATSNARGMDDALVTLPRSSGMSKRPVEIENRLSAGEVVITAIGMAKLSASSIGAPKISAIGTQ